MSNADAFLGALAACEGTDGPDGYRMLFGGKLFDGYVTHPNIRVPFVQTDGKANYSTAAGRYQILYATFVRLRDKLGTVDFTPATQDAMALELIAEAGAMPDVKAGNFQAAIDKCASIWASLPASKYPQPRRTIAFAENAFTQAGGVIA
jgi:muramidase (phage lysozyme)